MSKKITKHVVLLTRNFLTLNILYISNFLNVDYVMYYFETKSNIFCFLVFSYDDLIFPKLHTGSGRTCQNDYIFGVFYW